MHRLIVLCVLKLCVLLTTCIRVSAQDSTATQGKMSKDPTTAVLLSLPLPGLGQYYNEQYWKIPIFTGTCAFTGYLFFKNNADFNTTSDLYDQAVADDADQTVISRLFEQKEAYRDNRDLAGVVFLATYVIAAVDAYVGAHLYDFDVGDDLSVGIGPTRSQTLALSFRMRW